jgi:hypothetical protein
MNDSNQEDTSVVGFAATLLGFGILGALGILGYQIYFYLRSGYWLSISIITALGWLESEWALNPTQWLGLHEILDSIPLSVTSLALGFISLWAGISYDERKSHRDKEFGKELRRSLGYEDDKK